MISSISAWILSIAGVICLSVLVELILPNGQMNKYIKGIFSFIVLLVIIMPIPKLMGKNFNFSDMFGSSEIKVQEDYIYQINLNKSVALQKQINEEIKNLGYKNVAARLECDIFGSTFEIKSVYVDLSHLSISENAPHKDKIDIKVDIKKVVRGVIKIEEECIVFNE